ncbi:MAG: hypothetical protein LUF87_02010 [Alistipes sp.]|nr:hypothetical protein [Alistipes sp.]
MELLCVLTVSTFYFLALNYLLDWQLPRLFVDGWKQILGTSNILLPTAKPTAQPFDMPMPNDSLITLKHYGEGIKVNKKELAEIVESMKIQTDNFTNEAEPGPSVMTEGNYRENAQSTLSYSGYLRQKEEYEQIVNEPISSKAHSTDINVDEVFTGRMPLEEYSATKQNVSSLMGAILSSTDENYIPTGSDLYPDEEAYF